MDVILVKEIKNKGKVGESISVNKGYAMNYLIPQGYAIAATQASTQQFKELQKKEAVRIEEEKKEASKSIKEISGKTITLTAKADGDKLYGAIPPNSIAKQIKAELGASVKKEQVVIETPIKTLGEHKVLIQFHSELSTPLTVVINEEVEAAPEEEILTEEEATETEDQ